MLGALLARERSVLRGHALERVRLEPGRVAAAAFGTGAIVGALAATVPAEDDLAAARADEREGEVGDVRVGDAHADGDEGDGAGIGHRGWSA